MPRIEPLSQSVINKIAAGEVIERPASVVKELIENAVDAGSKRIDVSITAGGSEMIRVVDNGCGIEPGQLELAIAPHATSKIASADDLFSVGTLGFRGEALASISEVSRLLMRSRVATSEAGAQLEVVGGTRSEVTPCGCPIGTSIEVANLFFNTPVRRKFLRTTQTEFGHVSEAFTRIALARPEIHFSLRHNERLVFELPAADDWAERIAAVAGRSVAGSLLRVEAVDGAVRLAGYVAHPSQSRGNNRMQHLFLNGRCIRDRSLQHALGEAYRGLLTVGRFPIVFLWLEMPPDQVDVNVHPTKLEVRFQESGRLYSQILSTLRAKFLSTDLSTHVTSPEIDTADPTGAADDAQAERVRQQVVDWAKGETASWGDNARASVGGSTGDSGRMGVLALSRLGRPAATGSSGSGFPGGSGQTMHTAHPTHAEHPGDSIAPVDPSAEVSPSTLASGRAMQIHDRYLITASDDGVMVIDQHALHERILYEELRRRVQEGPIESQALLVPEPVDLSPSESAAAMEHRELFGRLGLRIEPFGGDTILVCGYPAMLANMHPGEVLREMLEHLLESGKTPERDQMLDELLHSIACKAAVKAGDRLSPDEIEALLKRRHVIDDPTHCPHGRPTALVFSRDELDRQFKRM